MKKAACAAFFVVLKHCVRSATERAATTTTAPTTTAAAVTTTATATATATALAATASRQAVDAGACRVGLATGVVAAARLIAARSKLIRHQGVDVARQFVAITAWATLAAGCTLARRAVVASVVAPVVESAFWTRTFVAVAFKTWRIAPEFAITPTITTPAALWTATS